MIQDNDILVKNLTKLYILVLLKSKNSVTEYYIIRGIEADVGKATSTIYVYNFLKKLKSEGYVEDVQNPKSKQAGGYHLTSSGSKFVDRIFSRFDNFIEVTIQSKLKIFASCGVKLYIDYYIETIGGKEMVFCCKHCAKAYKKAHHEI